MSPQPPPTLHQETNSGSVNLASSRPSTTTIETIKSHPVKLNLTSSNQVIFASGKDSIDPKFKGMRYHNHKIASTTSTSGAIASEPFEEIFQPKSIPVEKNFLRIDYLRPEGDENIDAAAANRRKKAEEIIQARKREEHHKLRQEKEKERQKQALAEQKKKKRQDSVNRSKANNSTNISTVTPVGPATPVKKVESTTMFKSKSKQSLSSVGHRQHSQSSRNKDAASCSSCCSCCQISPLSSLERRRNGSTSAKVTSTHRPSSASSKITRELNKSRCSQFGSQKSFSSVMNTSNSTRIAEHLSAKIHKILTRREEKKQFQCMKSIEKQVSEQLYGMFSRQAREHKQRKHEELEYYKAVQQRLSSPEDPALVERVNQIVRESLLKYQENRNKLEQEKKQKELIRMEREIALEQFSQDTRRGNSAKVASREQPVQDSKRIAWGADQRRLNEDRSASIEKPVKIHRKEKTDFKLLFGTKNATVPNEKTTKLQATVPVVATAATATKRTRNREPISQEDFDKKTEDRLKRIIEEKKQKANELRSRKEKINSAMQEVEKQREKSLNKCKKKVFAPTEKTIQEAFTALDEPESPKQVTKQRPKTAVAPTAVPATTEK